MHKSSYDKMTAFCREYLADQASKRLSILDVGSMNVNGCYRPLFENENWTYLGLDMEPGPNVDIVVRNPYDWSAVSSRSVDVVVSGQAFEHVEFFWITMLEIARVLKPGGLACILAPSSGPEHRYPTDCWRFYPDGMSAMGRASDLHVLSVTTQWDDKGYADGSDQWHDSMAVFRRPVFSPWVEFKVRVKRALKYRAMMLGHS